MNENLYALFQSRFPSDRSQSAIETAGGRIYSYAELESITASYAGLIKLLGVVPGDRVAVQVEKSPEALFLYLACLKAGAVYLPLNSAYQEGEVDYFLGDAETENFCASAEVIIMGDGYLRQARYCASIHIAGRG